MAYRLAPQAEADLENIAFYVFVESSSLEIADRLIQSITEDSICSLRIPALVALGMICKQASAAFQLVNTCCSTESNVRTS